MSDAENQIIAKAEAIKTIKEKEALQRDPFKTIPTINSRLQYFGVEVIHHAKFEDRIEIYISIKGLTQKQREDVKSNIYIIIYDLQKHYTTYMIQTIEDIYKIIFVIQDSKTTEEYLQTIEKFIQFTDLYEMQYLQSYILI